MFCIHLGRLESKHQWWSRDLCWNRPRLRYGSNRPPCDMLCCCMLCTRLHIRMVRKGWSCTSNISVCQESSQRVIPLMRHGSRPSQWSTKLPAVVRLQRLPKPSLEIPIRTRRWKTSSQPHGRPDTGSMTATKSRLWSRLWGLPVYAFHPMILAAKANCCTDLWASCSSQSCDDCVQLYQ